MSTHMLPEGWKTVKFGDVVRKVSDRVDAELSGIRRYVAGEHMDSDELRIRRWGEIGDGYLGPAFHMRFVPGQVLYGSRRTYLRKVAVADFEGICANTTFVLETSSSELLADFLPFVMTTESFHAYSIMQSKGSVNPYINFSDLMSYEFALPPIAEQHRIVEIMQVVDSESEGLTRASQEMSALIRALLTEIDESSRRHARIGSVAELERGVSYRSADYVAENTGRPFLNLKCVSRDGTFSPRGVKWVRSDFAIDNVVMVGDLFFANTDLTPSRLLVGAPFYFAGLSCADAPSFSMDLTRVRASGTEIPLELLYHLLNIPRVRSTMRSLTGGSTVGHLRLARVPEIEIPVPADPEGVLGRLRAIERTRVAIASKTKSTSECRGILREQLLTRSADVH